MHTKTIIFVLGTAVGIITGFSSPFASELAVAALMLGALEAGLYVWERKRDTAGVALSLFIALMMFGFFAGAMRVQFTEEKVAFVCATSCTFNGVVMGDVERTDAYQRFAVRAIRVGEEGYDIQIRTPLYPEVRTGETYAITGKALPPSIIYPHEGKRSFEYASYLRTRNIGSEMFFPSIERIDDEAHTAQAVLGRWKETFVAILNRYVSSPSSLLASGMLFGESSFTKEMKDTFRTAGLSHIVVLSGFNIAIIVSFAFLLFRFMPFVLRLVLAFFCVVMFVMMVGAETSVLRATIMACIGLLAMSAGRPYVARQALVVSLFAIIMYDPYALLHDVSLHLSFIATAGIVYLSKPITLLLSRHLKQKFVVELFSTTVAAYLVTLPYIAHVFGTVSLYALLANILVLPFVPVMMLVSFITVLAGLVSSHLALLVGFLSSLIGSYIVWVAKMLSGLPYANVTVSFSVVLLFLVTLGGVISFLLVRRSKKDETATTSHDRILTDIISY